MKLVWLSHDFCPSISSVIVIPLYLPSRPTELGLSSVLQSDLSGDESVIIARSAVFDTRG